MRDFLKVVVYGSIFAVPFLTMFVVNSYFFPFITGKNFAFRILVEIAVVAWGLLALIDAQYRPKFSWLSASFAALIVVMFFANFFGEHPATSFWSNFERMDGYVTLVHVFLYTIVLGSVLTTKKLWNIFLNVTLGVAFVVSLYGLSKYAGDGARIESYLGNAAYLAIYLLFHIFFTFWLFVQNKNVAARVIYGLLVVLFVFVLVQTGTRGTTLGLIAGATATTAYIALFGAKYPQFRRYAAGAFLLIVALAGSFFFARDTAFIQSQPNLARVADIDLSSDLVVRGTIWGMAWEGIKERPILGWGQGNFNYIFNAKYDPSLYAQEQWFDRVHNIFLDWLVAGGFLGLIAYLGIFASCFYYLVILPLRRPEDQTFTVLERGVLFGLLFGYMTHNLVVFDNLISYIFFAVVLALIHSRVGEIMPSLAKITVDRNLFNQFFVPVAGVLLVVIVYTMQLPGMHAASDVIVAYAATTPQGKLDAFERALDRGSFAHQELTEQIAQQAMSVVRDDKTPAEVKEKFVARAEEELKKLVAEKPGDARVHVFFSSFYRAIGNLDGADAEMNKARELSPRKPSIIMQQGIIRYSQGKLEEARDLFAEAYELDTRNNDAREYYAATLVATGDIEAAKALVADEDKFKLIALSDFYAQAVNEAGDTEYLIKLYQSRIEQKPEVAQSWASLSFLYFKNDNPEAAIDTLTKAGVAVPSFNKTAQCFIKNIEGGKEPQEGCQ